MRLVGAVCDCFGLAEGTRTPGHRVRSTVLFQLSYSEKLAEGERFERSCHVAATHRFPAGTDGPLLHPSLLWASPRVTASSHPGATRHLLALCLPCAAGSIRLDRLQWSLAFWRKMEHSEPTPCGALCFQGSAGAPVRFIFHDLVGVAGFEPAAACSQSRPSGR
jgi:hypothetical protein